MRYHGRMDTHDVEKSPRRPGPVPGPPTARYQVLLEPRDAEWAKTQPGGLSEMLRRLLKGEYDRAHGAERGTPRGPGPPTPPGP